MKMNIEKFLKKNRYLIYDANGTSMYPLLVNKLSKVRIEVSSNYQIFDVVLFKRKKNTYVLHRIIDIREDSYVVMGDNARHIDYLKKHAILGKLTGVYKDGTIVDLKELDINIPFKDKKEIDDLIKDSEAFFLKRKKEAYYELIKLATNSTYNDKKITKLTNRELIELCKYLEQKKGFHLLGYAISNHNLKIDKKISEIAETNYQVVIARMAKLEYTLNKIQESFESKGIKYIFLKGPEVKRLYKLPHLRNSYDLDVYVSLKDFPNAKEILLNELLCEVTIKSKHDEGFLYKLTNINIELHHSLSSYLPNDLKYLLDDPFKNAIKDKDFKYRYHLSNDDEGLYFLVHTAKHIRLAEFWYNSIIDYYYLKDNINEELIKEARLIKFKSCLDSYINYIYKNIQLSKVEEEFENLLFMNNNELNKVLFVRRKNKFKHALSRIFVPYTELKKKYIILEKHPILFPFLSIYRWISLPFMISKEGKQELKALKKENDILINKLKNSGLSEYLDSNEE